MLLTFSVRRLSRSLVSVFSWEVLLSWFPAYRGRSPRYSYKFTECILDMVGRSVGGGLHLCYLSAVSLGTMVTNCLTWEKHVHVKCVETGIELSETLIVSLTWSIGR